MTFLILFFLWLFIMYKAYGQSEEARKELRKIYEQADQAINQKIKY